ncbi:hypothetical protein [Mesorhizobium sp. M7D.F.Ca.US.005.01.1.1]|nr:hypothetical protein [Mesorhizobium sp. M7D.F.Ca.US.005.01.1.1]
MTSKTLPVFQGEIETEMIAPQWRDLVEFESQIDPPSHGFWE